MMLPFNAVFDTGIGMNIVKRDALLDGWEKLLDKDATMSRLGDANGRPLRQLGRNNDTYTFRKHHVSSTP